MKKNLSKVDLFPNPLFIIKDLLENSQRLQLIKDCYSWKKASTGVRLSNSGGWHSDNLLFKREEDSFKLLSKNIFDSIVLVNNNINSSIFKDGQSYKADADGWVNINKGSDFNAPHDHVGNTWSGCYYVKIPESSSSNIDTAGGIQFIDPNIGIKKTGETRIFNDMRKAIIMPKENVLLIFPSWLKHFVHPHREDGDRISIAFNIRI